jgi:hypothetical protein
MEIILLALVIAVVVTLLFWWSNSSQEKSGYGIEEELPEYLSVDVALLAPPSPYPPKSRWQSDMAKGCQSIPGWQPFFFVSLSARVR